jgi:hypothetical protein
LVIPSNCKCSMTATSSLPSSNCHLLRVQLTLSGALILVIFWFHLQVIGPHPFHWLSPLPVRSLSPSLQSLCFMVNHYDNPCTYHQFPCPPLISLFSPGKNLTFVESNLWSSICTVNVAMWPRTWWHQ